MSQSTRFIQSTTQITALMAGLLLSLPLSASPIPVGDTQQLLPGNLMSEQEEAVYLSQLRAATSTEERDAARKAYYAKLAERIIVDDQLFLPTEPTASGGTLLDPR